ncbi:class I SAM-dependent methyltransferase [Phycicoccus sp. MAQZ13P-2]|uniref:class I SAM-dependent methyltransferase n=1 Tax=Phycicoccus mangrovi TaxID=2840470 RepID=UPI001C0052A4|nr:class I SAM-dependent methyltransferase [Phycicoccus mangrovi]MBT9255724.1 class I SAM-dependent methyltransferase [Phycicoccus mangrovi]MBT9274318.1 class I SAM-dependent methyltransferase [Phycicoccus mangrovi]
MARDEVDGARTFRQPGEVYDRFMGRYSRALAPVFADAAGVAPGQRALDVGCGPGALTEVLVDRLGAAAVTAVDPSPPFVASCRGRCPGVDVREGRAEALPVDDGTHDVALAQLVLHFVSEPTAAAAEMVRVVRPGGTVAACVWEFSAGMEMLRLYWDAALDVDPEAPDEARTLRFGRPGEIADLFSAAGLGEVEESVLPVSSTYADVDELWTGFLAGIGPAGSHLLGLPEEQRAGVRAGVEQRLGGTGGPFTLGATARCAVARRPA